MALLNISGYDLNHFAWTLKGWYLLSLNSGHELTKKAAENFTTKYLNMGVEERLAYAEEIWYVLKTVFFNGVMTKEKDFSDEEDSLSMVDDWSMYELSNKSFDTLIDNL